MRNRMFLCALAAGLLAAGAAAADGAGGLRYGRQYVDLGYASSDLGIGTAGGFGYGVSEDGQRVGGFGFILYSDKGSRQYLGGVGGLITGGQGRFGPLIVGLDLLLGLGGAGLSDAADGGNAAGMMLAYGELELSVGLAFTRWMQIAAYAGFQGMANLFPGDAFRSFQYYSPTVGMRLLWGKFY